MFGGVSMIEDNAIFLFVRRLIGLACVPVLVLTGWRFSKVHRHTDDLVYFWIDTVGANYAAAQLTTFNKWRE